MQLSNKLSPVFMLEKTLDMLFFCHLDDAKREERTQKSSSGEAKVSIF